MEKVLKFVDDLNPILRNTLLVIALLWILKIVLFFAHHFFIGFRLFIYSRFRHLDLTSIYGEVVVITGATDGIGFEFARQFAQRGHSIVIIGRNEQKLKHAVETVSQLLLPGKKVSSIQMDLNTDDVSVYHNIRNELQEYANEIGILINNAG
ncbi:hydroxysteroid dehydrogenase-like protein 3, partial [Leptotrombidium deliense]